jgi:hypothetical protein
MAPGTLLARSARQPSAERLVCLAMLALGCSGEVVNLGQSPSALPAGGSADAGSGGAAGNASGGTAPQIWELQTQPLITQVENHLLANPTLTSTLQELYYSEQVRGGDPNPTGVWRAVRTSDGWATATPLMLGGIAMPDASSPAISADGQELWLGMNTTNSTDIFHSLRQGDTQWSSPVLVAELNSPLDDVPRPPGQHGLVMPISSKRHGGSPAFYQIYFSARPALDAPWGTPSQVLLGAIDSPQFQSADGFLTDDGSEIYFSSTRDGEDSDLYVARRATTDASFGDPEPLVDLNDPGERSEERMPWLSPDGKSLYFASDRSGEYGLYVAKKRP